MDNLQLYVQKEFVFLTANKKKEEKKNQIQLKAWFIYNKCIIYIYMKYFLF